MISWSGVMLLCALSCYGLYKHAPLAIVGLCLAIGGRLLSTTNPFESIRHRIMFGLKGVDPRISYFFAKGLRLGDSQLDVKERNLHKRQPDQRKYKFRIGKDGRIQTLT